MFGYVPASLSSRYSNLLAFERRFSVLIGPLNHLKHLISRERLPFTFVYFSTLGLTLYFSLGVSFPLSLRVWA